MKTPDDVPQSVALKKIGTRVRYGVLRLQELVFYGNTPNCLDYLGLRVDLIKHAVNS